MISLQESLVCRPILEKYNASIDSFDELSGNCGVWDKLDQAERETITSWLTQVYGEEITIIVSDKREVFKIPRYLTHHIDSVPAPSAIVVEKGKGDTDRSLYIVRGDKKIKFAVTGSGSIGRVTTRAQELATCVVWNAMVKEISNIEGHSNFNIESKAHIAEIVKELSQDFDAAWIDSFQKQVLCIREFLQSRGITNWQDYRACRYGGTDYVSDDADMRCKTGKAHDKFVQAYMALITKNTDERVQKDNFDPSDILIYKPGEGVLNEFNRLVGECGKDTATSENIIEEYRKMFNDNVLFGISLKKCNGKCTYDIFNIGAKTLSQAVKIDSVMDVHASKNSSANQAQLLVKGKFNMSGVSDPEHPDRDFKDNEIYITLRSFGKSNAMDVKETSGPAIGKVPVRMWTSMLGVKEDELSKAIVEFNKFTDKSHYKQLSELIAEGMKNGPWCLPFVLIH